VEVVSNGERFWFQVPSKKTVWTGAATGEARDAGTDDAPYQAIRPSDITSALLPEPLAPRDGETLLLDADRESFTLTLAAPAQGRGVARRRVSRGPRDAAARSACAATTRRATSRPT
jgi:hypothetical protein